MLLGAKFDITPIESVSVAMTALSKSVLGNDKNGILNNQVKSGWVFFEGRISWNLVMWQIFPTTILCSILLYFVNYLPQNIILDWFEDFK